MSSPAYYSQQQIDRQYAVYSADGRIARSSAGLLLVDIPTRGEADDYVFVLAAEAHEEAAQLADDHAAADAMACGSASSIGRAA